MKLEELNQKYKENLEEQEKLGEAEEKGKEKKERRKRTVILLSALTVLIIAAAAITIPRYFGSGGDEAEAENVEAEIMQGLPEGMDEGEIADALQQMIDDSMFTISVNTRPIFQNGNAKGTVNIVNSPQNHYPCRVTLTLDEDGTVVYKNNDLLYPEQYIPEVRLSQNLRKGVYDATLTYSIYEEDGVTSAGVMNAKMQLVIQN